MKKILAILCAIAMVCSLAVATSAAETTLDIALPSGSGWQQADTNTTLWGGTLDPSFLVAGGTLKIYLTANAADLWQVRLCLNGAQWTELDWHVDPTTVANPVGTIVDNGDGTLVVSFKYEDMVALYGTDDFVGTLGAITICTNAASDVTVNKVTYETASTGNEGGEELPKTGDAFAVVLGLMAVSAAAAVTIGKKKF